MNGITATPGIIVLAPVAIWAAVAVVGVIAGASATAWAISHFGQAAHRAKLALTGPRKSGKTTLRHLLSDGTITKEYIETRARETVDADVNMGDLELKLHVIDVGGDKERFGDWLDAARECQVMVYVIDVARMKTDRKYARLAEQGSRHLKNYRQNDDLDEKARIILVGSHIDQDPAHGETFYHDRTLGHRKIRPIISNLQPTQIVLANLLDRHDISKVLYTIAEEAGR